VNNVGAVDVCTENMSLQTILIFIVGVADCAIELLTTIFHNVPINIKVIVVEGRGDCHVIQ